MLLVFGRKSDEWAEHFFEGDTAVLEGVFVVIRVVIVVIWICEEVIFAGKNEETAQVQQG